MSVQIPYTFDRIIFPVQHDLIALHRLLYSLPDVAESGVYTGLPYTCVGGGFHGLDKRVILGVKGQGEGTVNHST